MKPIVILVLLAFALLANPARSESHLTEKQKTLQAELERREAVEVSKKKALANKESQQNTKSNTVKLYRRMPQYYSRSDSTYVGVISKNKSADTSLASSNPSIQSFQSLLKNTDWGSPTYSIRTIRQN